MIHATKILSNFAHSLNFGMLSSEVVETTKKYILDYYAAGFAGYRVNTVFNRAAEELMLEMSGKEECDFLLSKERIPAANAAFLSACYVHGADMDDGNRKAMGHVGAHVISTVLTLSQTLDVNGEDIITAINVGYEVYNRVAAAVQPGLVHRGFHSTGTAGAIACGAAAAKLMGMDADGIYNTMALCAVQASGLIIIAESGQCCKPINPANAAKTGIISAKMISKGVRSSVYPLESQKGFFHAMSDEIDEKMITEGLGETFTICESYMKPYPSCRHTHCGIECVLDIRRRLPKKAKIKAVKVYIYKNAIQIAGQIKVPKVSDDAKFSIHYSLACALMRGHFNLSDLDISDVDEMTDIIEKIELIEESSMENRDAGIRGSRVVVVLEDGTELEKTVLIPLGDAANPLSWEDLKSKLRGCAEGVLTDSQQSKLIENICRIEKYENIRTINIYN
ncbi:MAG: MmgE/PrpD family protein [Clostridia bacterium]|nr:MmgE/PrpD family protein [Clostridia bacterium]